MPQELGCQTITPVLSDVTPVEVQYFLGPTENEPSITLLWELGIVIGLFVVLVVMSIFVLPKTRFFK